MGISRDSQHKRRLTGGKKPKHHMKRKFEMGRQMAMTKIGPKRTREVRCRGGNIKHRALRLDTGNFSWGSEVCTRKTRVLDVVYNASNNELVRTKTLVKGAIVQVDATYAATRVVASHSTPCGRVGLGRSERLDAAAGTRPGGASDTACTGLLPSVRPPVAAAFACGRGNLAREVVGARAPDRLVCGGSGEDPRGWVGVGAACTGGGPWHMEHGRSGGPPH